MPSTKFEICSTALMSIGANAITDFAGGSTESAVAKQFYDTTVENWLSLYDWRFATTSVQLSRVNTTPLSPWTSVYQQPADMLKLLSVKVTDLPIPFTRYLDKIHCNAVEANVVIADYMHSVACEYWPPYFRTLIEHALAQRFAIVLAGKVDFKNTVSQDLELQFKLARNADARQQTTRRLPLSGRGSILEARRA
jgi:hypothetical protein